MPISIARQYWTSRLTVPPAIAQHHPDKLVAPLTRDGQRAAIAQTHAALSGGQAPGEQTIVSLNHAYEVLSDPHRRKEYDAELARQREQVHRSVDSFAASGTGSSSTAAPATSAGRQARIAAEISIEAFEAIEPDAAPSANAQAGDDDGETDNDSKLEFRYPCRCGNYFVVSADQLSQGVDIVQCSGCSEVVRVTLE